MYVIEGNAVLQVSNPGKTYEERTVVATCDEPSRCLKLWERARLLNDVKRQYTASARLIAEMETLPNFAWGDADEHDQRAEDEQNYNRMIGESLRRA